MNVSKRKYPRHANWLIYKRRDEGSYEVENFITEKKYLLSFREARLLKKLDGKTSPYRIFPDVDKETIREIISEFKEYELVLEEGEDRLTSGDYSYDKAFFIPKINVRLAKILNFFLLVSFLPVFCLGIWMLKSMYTFEYMWSDYWWLGILFSVIGTFTGLLLHELAHAIGAISAGGRCFQIGFMYERFIPAMYALIDIRPIKNKFRKAQVMAAGIESNLLYAGVWLILGGIFHQMESFCIATAITNIISFLVNVTLIKSIDGSHILASLMGLDGDFVDKCKEVVLSRKKRKNILKKRGIVNGCATIMFAVSIIAAQIMLPVLYLIDIVFIIGVFL